MEQLGRTPIGQDLQAAVRIGRRRIPLRAGLALLLGAIPALTVLLTAAVLQVYGGDLVMRRAAEQLRQAGLQIANRLDTSLHFRARELQMFSRFDFMQTPDWDRARVRAEIERLNTGPRGGKRYTFLGVFDARGTIVIANDGLLEGVDASTRPVFQEGRKGLFFGDVHEAVMLNSLLNPGGREPLHFIDVAVPLTDRNGAVIGVLGSHLDWRWAERLRQDIVTSLGLAKSDLGIAIVDSTGKVLPGPLDDDNPAMRALLARAALESDGAGAMIDWPDGRFLTIAVPSPGYDSFPGLGWHIVLRRPETSALSALYDFQRNLWLLGSALAAAFALAGWWLAGYLARVFTGVSDTASAIAAGARDIAFPPLPAAAPRELTDLHAAIRTMAAALIEAERHIRADNRALADEVAARTAELQASTRLAQSATRAKSEFLANMSHELRTPLNALLGMITLMLYRPLDPEARQYATVAQESGRHLLALINDILDLSRLETGQIDLQPEDFAPESLFRGIIELVQQRAAEKDLPVQLHIAGLLPIALRADARRLRQVTLNLVGNAIKFTDHGRIDVFVACRPLDDGHFELSCTVRDTGIGMTAEDLQKLFRRFSQVDLSATRRHAGSGLGLAISRQLIQAMGGDISVESSFGAGSEFRFTIRCARALAMPEVIAGDDGSLPPLPRLGLRLLVAEDHPGNQMLVRSLLTMMDCQCEVVETGRAAVEAVQQRGPFDAVLMDGQMPEMDGVTATREIRALAGPAARTPVIMLTANAMKGDRERYIAAGATDFVPKPIDQYDLVRALRRLGGMAPAEVAVPAAEATGPALSAIQDAALSTLLGKLRRTWPVTGREPG